MEKTNRTEKSSPGTLAYELEGSLYLNITNNCTAHCLFCNRLDYPRIGCYDLSLSREPELEDFQQALEGAARFKEVVFCGFGEPVLRLDLLTAIGKDLKARSISTRLNTNGHGNLIHKRNIIPDLASFLGTISISLNAQNAETYYRLCRPAFGMDSYAAVLDFARGCIGVIPKVILTVVEHQEVDIEACRQIATGLGAGFRVRRYYEHIQESQRFLP